MSDRYKITFRGCDDKTVIEMELSRYEYMFVEELMDKMNEEANGDECKPRLTRIEPIEAPDSVESSTGPRKIYTGLKLDKPEHDYLKDSKGKS